MVEISKVWQMGLYLWSEEVVNSKLENVMLYCKYTNTIRMHNHSATFYFGWQNVCCVFFHHEVEVHYHAFMLFWVSILVRALHWSAILSNIHGCRKWFCIVHGYDVELYTNDRTLQG
jgi:hypothetical protein